MSTDINQQPVADPAEVVGALDDATRIQLVSSTDLTKGSSAAANASQSMMDTANNEASFNQGLIIASAVLGSLFVGLSSFVGVGVGGIATGMLREDSLVKMGAKVATGLVGLGAASVGIWQGVLSGQIETNGAAAKALMEGADQANKGSENLLTSNKDLMEAAAAIVNANRVVTTNS